MTDTHSIKTTLLLAATQLKAQGIDNESAKLEAQLLLQHSLNVNRAWLIAHENDALEANIHAACRALINRRINGEPIAYILGYREFYGLKLKVTPDTLIPRADTETLVETALAKIPLILRQAQDERGIAHHEQDLLAPALPELVEGCGHNELRILDLGTGTGAIALAIAKHRPQAHVTAVDASQAALNIAIENAQNLKIANVNFILSNWFSALKNEKFDLIVSNPPYIEAADAHLSQGDLRFEPLSALASGDDGLDAIRTIILQAPQHLNPHGWLMLEHGYNQAERVAALLKNAGFIDIETLKDLGNNNRVTFGKLC
jgi:release factor glutamine methyltransferase